MFAVFGVLFLLGGLVQINPIWLWGPYHVGDSTNGAQPDWYLGWLIGALRLVPGFDLTIGHYTLVPNPFWGGVLFPAVVFGILFLWPWIERRATGDHRFHNLLDRPRDAPWRTAIGAALLAWVFVIFVAGAADRIYVTLRHSVRDARVGVPRTRRRPAARRARRDASRVRRAPARRRGEGAAARGAGAQPVDLIGWPAGRRNGDSNWGIEPVPERLRVLGTTDTFLLWTNFGISILVLVSAAYLGLSLKQALLATLLGGADRLRDARRRRADRRRRARADDGAPARAARAARLVPRDRAQRAAVPRLVDLRADHHRDRGVRARRQGVRLRRRLVLEARLRRASRRRSRCSGRSASSAASSASSRSGPSRARSRTSSGGSPRTPTCTSSGARAAAAARSSREWI